MFFLSSSDNLIANPSPERSVQICDRQVREFLVLPCIAEHSVQLGQDIRLQFPKFDYLKVKFRQVTRKQVFLTCLIDPPFVEIPGKRFWTF